MKLLKNSLAVSAITVALGMFFFVGCDDGKEIEIIKEPDGEKEKTTARISFYGGGERRGAADWQFGTNAHLDNLYDNTEPTSRWYYPSTSGTALDGTPVNHQSYGFYAMTIDTAYIILKYPTLSAGHFDQHSSSVRHAAADHTLTENVDPSSPDPEHPICETYAVNLMKPLQQYLGSVTVEPGQYGTPWVRVFWPGADGANAANWWNRVKDVDPDKKAKQVLQAKNAGYYFSGRITMFEQPVVGDTVFIPYTYEVQSRAELGPQTWGGNNYWDVGAGQTLHFNIHPHSDHWLGRFRDFQVYLDLATLKEPDTESRKNHVIFSPEKLAGYTLRPRYTGTTAVTAGWNFMNLIDGEFYPRQGFDSDFTIVLDDGRIRGLD
ncbi:MAG: hypothetical protein FWF51_03165 [Chitinivibrionia bacterium]|nr:hypothetical protein [Chitinivibrionia bacterium]MCL1946139.1 hypothetical protein [Chitinivibrionia bacterium]